MQVWYFSAVNFVFGFVCLVYVHVGYAGSDGMACAGPQSTRHSWLLVEIIYFWTLFFCYQLPCCVIAMFKKPKIEEILNHESEEESD